MEPLIGMGIGYREDKDRDDADEVEGVEDWGWVTNDNEITKLLNMEVSVVIIIPP
jgi:hypothetical protein